MGTGLNPSYFVALSAALFVIGIYGALSKKNAIAVLISIELMLTAVNINLVAFNKFLTPETFIGQIFAIFVITVAAAEVGLGLAIVIAIYRLRGSVDLDDFDLMKW
ncbi:NAD(P)H-quinone oxidoreductase subunit 4L [Desulfotomaculum nigrificans CO-1-SRB]|uniref:NADH-quinone oxidoreductase subunit K n=1 Tax=Desulfotomaculum nigrificans (strain DSM 14880 / VKM B-2319 / CO-1-SRB) TaxID=868595 RepID=F6B3F8_DESCC|nr:NADH-quinone oxidoreductase subunit NuoK [Desulfotomaculum nigrificans]AEF93987.1 NAD(P)H-quinone oxidoreductase subunit 4L [Desulfotomaculum nigrificans CO-1-SRB]